MTLNSPHNIHGLYRRNGAMRITRLKKCLRESFVFRETTWTHLRVILFTHDLAYHTPLQIRHSLGVKMQSVQRNGAIKVSTKPVSCIVPVEVSIVMGLWSKQGRQMIYSHSQERVHVYCIPCQHMTIIINGKINVQRVTENDSATYIKLSGFIANYVQAYKLSIWCR